MRGHAIANSLYVVAVNRVGTEDKLKFWGQSFICDAFGKIIKRAGIKNQILILVAFTNSSILHFIFCLIISSILYWVS